MQSCRQMFVLVLLLLLFLAGCEGTGGDGDGDTALLRISIGGSGATAQQQGAEAPLSPVIPRQGSPAIPVEVDQIRLMVDRPVSVGGTVFPANSAIDIPIDPSRDTASLTLEIDANIAHQFTIEALNEQQEIIFQRVFNVNVDPGPQSLTITLMAVSPGPGPMVVSPLVDITLVLFADEGQNIDVSLAEVFLDDNNEVLTLTAASNNTALVTTEVMGTTLILSILPGEEDSSALITVTATDESGNLAMDLFFVTVRRITGGSGGSP